MKETRYGLQVETDLDVVTAEQRIKEALAAEGFGVLTEIDMAGTLRAKLGEERAPYKILGACNPPLASRALNAEEMIGLLLPCNVIVSEADGHTVVAALEPGLMAQLTDNPELDEVAKEARSALERALSTLE